MVFKAHHLEVNEGRMTDTAVGCSTGLVPCVPSAGGLTPIIFDTDPIAALLLFIPCDQAWCVTAGHKGSPPQPHLPNPLFECHHNAPQAARFRTMPKSAPVAADNSDGLHGTLRTQLQAEAHTRRYRRLGHGIYVAHARTQHARTHTLT